MKERFGFVSNSSSTCYILDLCDEETETIIKQLKKMKILNLNDSNAAIFSRCTCFGVSAAVTKFAQEQKENEDPDWDNYEETNCSFSTWLFNAVEQLGEANTIFIRVSDEDNGISVELKPELIYAEREYH